MVKEWQRMARDSLAHSVRTTVVDINNHTIPYHVCLRRQLFHTFSTLFVIFEQYFLNKNDEKHWGKKVVCANKVKSRIIFAWGWLTLSPNRRPWPWVHNGHPPWNPAGNSRAVAILRVRIYGAPHSIVKRRTMRWKEQAAPQRTRSTVSAQQFSTVTWASQILKNEHAICGFRILQITSENKAGLLFRNRTWWVAHTGVLERRRDSAIMTASRSTKAEGLVSREGPEREQPRERSTSIGPSNLKFHLGLKKTPFASKTHNMTREKNAR